MYKDSTIVWELTRHRCGLGSIFRPTQCKRNLKIVLNFVISSPPCYRFLFFFFLSSLVLYTGYLNKPSNFKFEWEHWTTSHPMEVLMLKSKLFFILILFCSTEGGEVQKKVSQYRPSAGRRDEADPHLMVQSKHPKVYFHQNRTFFRSWTQLDNDKYFMKGSTTLKLADHKKSRRWDCTCMVCQHKQESCFRVSLTASEIMQTCMVLGLMTPWSCN